MAASDIKIFGGESAIFPSFCVWGLLQNEVVMTSTPIPIWKALTPNILHGSDWCHARLAPTFGGLVGTPRLPGDRNGQPHEI